MKFGSVTRLRKATPEQIGEVTGITSKLAMEIEHFLKTH
jgi:ERCC4-type nuclease